jgi:hypothetical protein
MEVTIHWGVLYAMYEAAETYIEEAAAQSLEPHKRQLEIYQRVMQDGSEGLPAHAREGMTEAEAWRENEREATREVASLQSLISETQERIDEVKAFFESKPDVIRTTNRIWVSFGRRGESWPEINKLKNDGVGFRDLLTYRVRQSLLISLERHCDLEKWARWERDEELARQEQRVMDRGLLPYDEQFAMYKAAELLKWLPDGAADGQRGRKVKLTKDVFEREIFPILDEEFPSGGDNAGIIKRCEEIGKRHKVSGSCIKGRFYDMRMKKQGNKSGYMRL